MTSPRRPRFSLNNVSFQERRAGVTASGAFVLGARSENGSGTVGGVTVWALAPTQQSPTVATIELRRQINKFTVPTNHLRRSAKLQIHYRCCVVKWGRFNLQRA